MRRNILVALMIAAARKKGKWVGGMPVLGYDVDPTRHKLVVNEEEAAKVRTIFGLYLEFEALIPVVQELERRGWLTKQWITRKGNDRGGKLFTKNSLFRLLTNVVYTSKVAYKDAVYEGEHEAIVEPEIWQRVQNTLRRNGRTGGKAVRNKYGALLKGLIYCEPCGTAMIHSYTAKKGKRYRYYVCLTAQQRGWANCPSQSLNAQQIENAVVEHIRGMGNNQAIVEATAERAREESQHRVKELETEKRSHERTLKRLHSKLQKLTGASFSAASDKKTAIDRLADLQDQIRTIEQRLTTIREEALTCQREVVDADDLAKVLAAFDPVWESLSPREQCRIIKLLVERVAYDGRTKNVTVTFRSRGIKALCSETNIDVRKEVV